MIVTLDAFCEPSRRLPLSQCRAESSSPVLALPLAAACLGRRHCSPAALTDALEAHEDGFTDLRFTKHKPIDERSSNPNLPPSVCEKDSFNRCERRELTSPAVRANVISVDEIVERLKGELEPCVRTAATEAAAKATVCEVERTREWFRTKALPKAVRVARSESYHLYDQLLGLAPRRVGGDAGRPDRRAFAFETLRDVQDRHPRRRRLPQEIRQTSGTFMFIINLMFDILVYNCSVCEREDLRNASVSRLKKRKAKSGRGFRRYASSHLSRKTLKARLSRLIERLLWDLPNPRREERFDIGGEPVLFVSGGKPFVDWFTRDEYVHYLRDV